MIIHQLPPEEFFRDTTQDLFIPPDGKILPEVRQERNIPFWVVFILMVLIAWAITLIAIFIVSGLVNFRGGY